MTYRLSSASLIQHAIWVPTRIFMHVCCSAKIRGLENLRKIDSNAIVATSHVTEIDPLLIVSSFPFFSRGLPLIFVAKEKAHYKSKWKGIRRLLYGGVLFRMIGGYEAYGGLNNYEKSLRNHLNALEKGLSVCIFPVGRLHGIDAYKDARGGVAYLAAKTGLPIIPVHIEGVHRKTTLMDCLLRRPNLTVTFGEPTHAKDIFKEPIASISETSQRECEKAAVRLMKTIVKL